MAKRVTGGRGRRRRLLLGCCGLALGLPGMPALAINECGAVLNGGTATCADTLYPNGIQYGINAITVNVGAPAGQNAPVNINTGFTVHGIRLGDTTNTPSTTGDQFLNVGDNVTINVTHDDRDGVRIATSSGDIVANIAGSITTNGNNSSGIHAQSTGGTVTIDSSADITVHSTDSGDNIDAGIFVGPFTTPTSLYTIVQSGSILATGTAAGVAMLGGIAGSSITINGDVTVANSQGVIGFFGSGGTVTINGTVTAGGFQGHGVNVFTIGNPSGPVSVLVAGSVTAGGIDALGVRAVSMGGSTVTVTASGSVQGGSGAGAGVELSHNSGGSPLLANQGLVTALSDRAVKGISGALSSERIQNSGTIVGFVEFFEGTDSFDNQSGGLWVARGGQVAFGDDADSLVNRTGAVVAIDGTQSWSDLESFTNAGRLSLQEADAGAFDQDLTVFSTFTFAGDYVGQNGIIALDTVVDVDGSPSDLVVFTGSVSGTGRVAINNIGGLGGGTTGQGILVVDAAAASGDLSLSLAQPVIFGALQYKLVEEGQQWFLRSSPFSGAADYPVLLSSALVAWQAGLGPLHERFAALRQAAGAEAGQTASLGVADLAEGRPGHGNLTGGGWAHAFWSDLSLDPSDGASFDQDSSGLQAGFDIGLRDLASEGDRLLGGLFVGRFGSTAKISGSDGKVELEGTSLGAYVAYLDGPLHLDGVVKVDLAEATFRQPASLTDARSDVTTWGLSLEGGWRFDLDGFYIEPQAQLTWARATADDFTDGGGATIDLQDGTSVKGRLGARAGTFFTLEDGSRLAPYLEVGVLHEFAGESTAVATGTTLVSDLSGTAGQVGGGLEAVSADGRFALVADIDYGFGSSSSGFEGSLAVRFNW